MNNNISILRVAAVMLSCMIISFSALADKKNKVGKKHDKSHHKVEKVHQNATHKVEKLRAKANKRLARMLDRTWRDGVPQNPFKATIIDPVVPEPPVNPEPLPEPIDREIAVDPIIVPIVDPEPIPEPIVEPEPKPVKEPEMFHIDYIGLDLTFPMASNYSISSLSNLGNEWNTISSRDDFDALASRLSTITRSNSITGWMALDLADRLAEKFTSDHSSRSMLHTWLLVQIGYDMRLVQANNRLYSSFRTRDIILSTPKRNFFSANIDGDTYYIFQDTGSSFPPFMIHPRFDSRLKPVSLSLRSLPTIPASEKKTAYSIFFQ